CAYAIRMSRGKMKGPGNSRGPMHAIVGASTTHLYDHDCAPAVEPEAVSPGTVLRMISDFRHGGDWHAEDLAPIHRLDLGARGWRDLASFVDRALEFRAVENRIPRRDAAGTASAFAGVLGTKRNYLDPLAVPQDHAARLHFGPSFEFTVIESVVMKTWARAS